MNRILFIALALLLACSCKKEKETEPQPAPNKVPPYSNHPDKYKNEPRRVLAEVALSAAGADTTRYLYDEKDRCTSYWSAAVRGTITYYSQTAVEMIDHATGKTEKIIYYLRYGMLPDSVVRTEIGADRIERLTSAMAVKYNSAYQVTDVIHYTAANTVAAWYKCTWADGNLQEMAPAFTGTALPTYKYTSYSGLQNSVKINRPINVIDCWTMSKRLPYKTVVEAAPPAAGHTEQYTYSLDTPGRITQRSTSGGTGPQRYMYIYLAEFL